MSENTNQEEVSYSPEQLAELKAKQIAFYEDQLPILRLQTEFEELKARTNVARFESIKSRLDLMQLEFSIKESAESAANAENEPTKEK